MKKRVRLHQECHCVIDMVVLQMSIIIIIIISYSFPHEANLKNQRVAFVKKEEN